MRIFIGVPCHEEIRAEIEKVKNSLIKDIQKSRITDSNNYHLTLYFIGDSDIDFVEQLSRKLEESFYDMKPFQISYDHIGTFSKPNGDILWIGLNEGKPELNKIYQSILSVLKSLSFPTQNTSYSPHLTLARQLRYDKNQISLKKDITPIFDIVEKIHIYLSHQVDGKLTYTPLKTIKFKS